MFCALCGANKFQRRAVLRQVRSGPARTEGHAAAGRGVWRSRAALHRPHGNQRQGHRQPDLRPALLLFPIALLAIVLGHLSLSDIRKAAGRITGRGMAIAGLALGYTGVAIIPVTLIVAAIAIPNLLRARSAANEASAAASLRMMGSAAIMYNNTYSNGFPASVYVLGMPALGHPNCDHAGLIDRNLVAGQKTGYFFTYTPQAPAEDQPPVLSPEAAAKGCTVPGAAGGFIINADPVTRGSTGRRSFMVDQTGVIRYEMNGPATAHSRPLR